MLIQLILIAAIAVIIARLGYKFAKKELTRSQFFIWLCLWLLGALIIGVPALTSRLAELVGIGRGVDLVVYVSIIVIFYLLSKIIARQEKIERNITDIVRAMAQKDK